MLIKFRFIEPLSAVTPVFNTLLTAGDKITDVFSKLQGLLAVRKRRTVIIAQVTGGASTTSDVTLASLVIPGSELRAADVIKFFVLGYWNKPNAGTNTVRLWVKVNGVDAGTITHLLASSVTDQPISFDGELVIRSIAAAGVVTGGLRAFIHRTATAFDLRVTQGTNATVNTQTDITITVGIGFATSNANNRVTAEILTIVKE
jgi:hypothetical protein